MRAALAVVTGLALVVVAAPVPKDSPWVTVRGRVAWPKDEKLPAFEVVRAKCCQEEGEPFVDDGLIVNPQSRGVKNVVVWLRPDTKDWKDTFPKDRIHPDLRKPKPVKHVIEMARCQFTPKVFAAREGDSVAFRSSPSEAHALSYASGTVEQQVRIPIDDKPFTAEDPVAADRRPILFHCLLHQFKEGYGMRGYARVFDHPYFAVTDSGGHFEMKLVPKGNWRIAYWHERGFHKGRAGASGFPFRVGGDGPTQDLKAVELELPKPEK